MTLVATARTDQGRVRSNNEDAYYLDPREGLFIVADGLGGHRAGEVASRLAVEEIVYFARKPQGKSLGGEDLLRKAVKEANRKVFAQSSRNPGQMGMGTTLVMAMVKEDVLWLAHVGDSRAYLKSEKTFEQLTKDHTLLYEVGQGDLPEHYTKSGALSRAVGTQRDVEVDTMEISYRDGILLLCTDGLTNMLEKEEIEHILKTSQNPQKLCDTLVDSANRKGGVDNITVIVVVKTDQPIESFSHLSP
jgi:serine/threonine protein phosphatase PrpC